MVEFLDTVRGLGGTQIVQDEGHFGDWNQPYDTFDLLDRLIAYTGRSNVGDSA